MKIKKINLTLFKFNFKLLDIGATLILNIVSALAIFYLFNQIFLNIFVIISLIVNIYYFYSLLIKKHDFKTIIHVYEIITHPTLQLTVATLYYINVNLLFLMVFIVLIAQVKNILVFKSKFFSISQNFYLMISFIIYFIKTYNENSFKEVNFLLYLLTSVIVMIISIITQNQFFRHLNEQENKYQELEQKFSHKRTFNSIIIHDIKNKIQNIILEIQLNNQNTVLIKDLIKIGEDLSFLQKTNVVKIKMSKIIAQLVQNKGFKYKINDYQKNDILIDVEVFISIVINLTENAFEAYKRKNMDVSLFLMTYNLFDQKIEIIDNAGGFDFNSIIHGKSEKNRKGSGFYLAHLIENQKNLNLKINFEKIENGTKIIVEFLK